jgi:hypothetical protein
MSAKAAAPAAKAAAPAQGQRQMQRYCACGAPTYGDSQCESCKQGRQVIQRKERGALSPRPTLRAVPRAGFNLTTVPVQAKLSISQPGDAYEREADRAADVVMNDRPAAPPSITPYRAAPAPLPDISPAQKEAGAAPEGNEPGFADPLFQRGPSSGAPLSSPLRAHMENRFGADFSAVRLHTGSDAAHMSDAINAQAFTHGQHIYFSSGAYQPASQDGQRLLAHELAHTVQQGAGANASAGAGLGSIHLWRQPKDATKTPAKPIPSDQQKQKEEWTRLQIEATGMDVAAQVLARAGLSFKGAENRQIAYVGLHPDFLKIYDKTGRTLARIPLQKIKGLKFNPGVYVQGPKGLVAITTSTTHPGDISVETSGRSQLGQVPYTAKEKQQIAEETKKAEAEGRAPKLPPGPTLNIEKAVTDPEKYRSTLMGIPNVLVIYFVPSYIASGSGKSGGKSEGIYSSPIEGRDDGQPANAPPWPVEMDGPKMAPIDSDPTFSAKINWAANGNYSLASQVITQVGEDIHYKWEMFNVTEVVNKELAKQSAAKGTTASADAKPSDTDKPEKTLDQRIEDYKTSKAGSGKDVTGMGGAKREFRREFEDWWKDTKRAQQGSRDPSGDTVGERLSNQVGNRLAVDLAPVSLLITAVGAIGHLIADLFAGPRQQQEIPLQEKGYFLIRVITTPAVGQNTKGEPVIRPPSVDGKIVEVKEINSVVQESLDEPGAQLAKLQADIDLAKAEGNFAKAEYLSDLLKEAKRRFEASPLDLLVEKRNLKQKELDEFRKQYPTLSDYSRQREVETLEDQIALFNLHEGKLGGTKLKRVNASLISEVTAEQYPLLISAGPMSKEDGKDRWLISDVTNRDGDEYIGVGDTPSAAFKAALDKFAGKAAYGRGRIGVRTAGLGLEQGAKDEFLVDSAPTDWAIAKKRIDDLVTVLVALGLIVASAGTAGAVIGAAAAAARLIERWRAGKLYLDANTVGDVLGVLGGLGVAGQIGAGLRLQKFDKFFSIIQDGRATEAEIAKATEALKGLEGAAKFARGVELANEAIGYAGLVWGDVSLVDQMMSISEQERTGAITHAAARRQRSEAISSAVQNHGLFIAGNVKKAREQAKGAAGEGKGAGVKEEKQTTPAEKQTTPGEKGRGDEFLPEEGNHPAQKAGDPVPLGERRATLKEMQAQLSPDLHKLVVIDETLKGDHVQADYKLNEKTGQITEITLRCGPDARPETVGLHEETVRTMQKYQGFGGRVRIALSWVQELLGFTPETPNPEKRVSFEAALEIQKLPKLIEAQMEAMKKMEPNARAEAEAELDHMRSQLEENLYKLDLGEGTEASGFVAKKGLSKAKLKDYNELLEKLRPLEPGTKAHKDIRRKMYKLAGGDLPPETWNKVYDANVERANKANEAVAAEQQRLGLGKTEQTVKVGKGETRRLDIASIKSKKGIEVKEYETGTIYRTEDIESEVRRDAQLVKQGWDIKWILIDTEPSEPLRKLLLDSGIRIEKRTRKGSGDTVFKSIELPPTK